VPFLLGTLLALLRLIPEEWVNQYLKFWVSVVLIVVISIYLVTKAFYIDLKKYLNLRYLVREYYRFMPRTFKYLEYKRTLHLDRDGNGDIEYFFSIKNISGRLIHKVAIPVALDVYAGDEDEDRRTVIEARISTHVIIRPHENCYEPSGIFEHKDGTRSEHGWIIIPLGEIGGLKPTKDVDVFIKVHLVRAYEKMDTGEYTTVNVYHPMEAIEMIVTPPDGKLIMLNPSEQFSTSVEVWDKASKIIDHLELSEISIPEVKDNMITWKIKEPKIGYAYKLRFKTIETGQHPEQGSH